MTELEKFTTLTQTLNRYLGGIAEGERYRAKTAESGATIDRFPVLNAEHVAELKAFTDRMGELWAAQQQANANFRRSTP